MNCKRTIGKGVYIVVDPSMDIPLLYERVGSVLNEPIAALQIWDNFGDNEPRARELIHELSGLCHAKNVAVLINNRWQYLADTPLDGVHFDSVPDDYALIQTRTKRPFLSGLTCTNDMWPIQWAADNGIDYISFCSMFPSATAGECELVDHDSVQRARAIYGGAVFLAGGIRPDNLPLLERLPYTGVAVISGVMNSDDPGATIGEYAKYIKKR